MSIRGPQGRGVAHFLRDHGEQALGMALADTLGMATQSRSAALLIAMLAGSGAALAGSKSGSMRVGVQVVSSLRLVASATPSGSLGVEMRSFGGKASAVLVQQRYSGGQGAAELK